MRSINYLALLNVLSEVDKEIFSLYQLEKRNEIMATYDIRIETLVYENFPDLVYIALSREEGNPSLIRMSFAVGKTTHEVTRLEI